VHAPHRPQPRLRLAARAGRAPRLLRDARRAPPQARPRLPDRAGRLLPRLRRALRDERLPRRGGSARDHRPAGRPGGAPVAAARVPLVVVGDYAWDVLIQANTELLAGGDIYGEVQLAPGGSAANAAVWARRCGLPTRFIGKIGNDRFGRLAQDELMEEDVRAVWLSTDAHYTGAVAVWIDHAGQRSMVSGKGADHYLLPSELPEALLGRTGHLHLSAWSFFGDPPRAAARRAAQVAKEAGATLSFDPGSFQLIAETGLETFVSFTADLGIDLIFP